MVKLLVVIELVDQLVVVVVMVALAAVVLVVVIVVMVVMVPILFYYFGSNLFIVFHCFLFFLLYSFLKDRGLILDFLPLLFCQCCQKMCGACIASHHTGKTINDVVAAGASL